MLHREVTARLEAWRLLLFIICLENQGNDSSNEHAELKNPFPCNIHTCHELRSDCHRQSFYFYSLRDAPPHSLTIGGKEASPPTKSRGTAYRGTTGSTGNGILQDSTDCKGSTAQLRLRVSAAFLPHFRSSKNGKYIQYSSIFGTLNWGKNSG